MAATTTAKLIQVRPNHHRLNTFRLLSSSSTTPTPPPPTPPQSDDNKPPPEPNSSGSQFSSYFNDVKSTLKQSQQQMNPSSFRPFPAPDSPPPAQKLPSLEEIGKTLSGFRHRTVPSSTPAGNQPPSSSSSFPQISFQEILKRNSSGLQGGSPLPNDEKPGTPKFSSIRESLNQLKLTTAANNPKLTKSMAEYQQSVRLRLHPNDHQGRIDSDSNKVIGGTDPLPLVVFGKELGFAEDYPAMRTEFVKDYKVQELGEKLKSLRPEKKKGENKDWFSLFELNERLAKLREMELEMEKGNNGPIGDMKNVLMKLKVSNQDKIRKESMQRLESRDVLTRHGRTPSFMLEPPKEELVEKYFHPDNMSASEKLKLELQKIRDEFKMSETDCGSARVQVAQLTTKINHLAGVLHKKDKHSRKGLQGMLQKRKSLLKYLRRTDWESYSFVLSRLGLRDNPDMKR